MRQPTGMPMVRGATTGPRWLGKDGSVRDFTYGDLRAQQPLCQRVGGPGSRQRRPGLRPGRASPRPLHRRAGHPEARQVFCPLFACLWSGTDLSTLLSPATIESPSDDGAIVHWQKVAGLRVSAACRTTGGRLVPPSGGGLLPKGAVHVHEAVLAHYATGKSRSTSIPTTSSGAPPTRAGSPARPTASSRRSPTA